MKRVLLTTILGLAASAASSYGQANFFFDTYVANPSYLVVWTDNPSLVAAGGTAGQPVWNSEGFVADILWQYTISGNTYNGDALATDPLVDSPGYGPGYIEGGQVSTANSYNVDTTPILFTIEVWKGASWASASARGSLTWTETQYYVNVPAIAFAGMTGNIIVATPEPSTFALAGLGAAALLIFRKRQ